MQKYSEAYIYKTLKETLANPEKMAVICEEFFREHHSEYRKYLGKKTEPSPNTPTRTENDNQSNS